MKIGFLITARLKSARLPLKVIKDLNGKTVMERVIERAKAVRGLSEVVLCTSTNPQDRELVDIARKCGIYYYNGDEDDVLRRLLDAAKLFGLDYFIGITADNPLATIRYSEIIIDKIKETKADFIKLRGLPLGCATYGMKVKALETVCAIKTVIDTEMWGKLIDRPEVFDIRVIEIDGKMNRPGLRLTLDYQEDYELFDNIYRNITGDEVLDLEDVIDYLDDHSEVASMNKHCVQMVLDEQLQLEIDRCYAENIEEIRQIKKRIYAGSSQKVVEFASVG